MNPFVAEIRIFPFNFPPAGWASCNGQLLPISQNTALFSLLGTTYGGDGKSNFALPNLQGRVPMHPGQGPGLSNHDLGEWGGAVNVVLLEAEIPGHSHALRAASNPMANRSTPDPLSALTQDESKARYQSNVTTDLVPLDNTILSAAGGDGPHNNMQPYLTVNFCIALQGIFPSRQ